jgi:hypothetical protein
VTCPSASARGPQRGPGSAAGPERACGRGCSRRCSARPTWPGSSTGRRTTWTAPWCALTSTPPGPWAGRSTRHWAEVAAASRRRCTSGPRAVGSRSRWSSPGASATSPATRCAARGGRVRRRRGDGRGAARGELVGDRGYSYPSVRRMLARPHIRAVIPRAATNGPTTARTRPFDRAGVPGAQPRRAAGQPAQAAPPGGDSLREAGGALLGEVLLAARFSGCSGAVLPSRSPSARLHVASPRPPARGPSWPRLSPSAVGRRWARCEAAPARPTPRVRGSPGAPRAPGPRVRTPAIGTPAAARAAGGAAVEPPQVARRRDRAWLAALRGTGRRPCPPRLIADHVRRRGRGTAAAWRVRARPDSIWYGIRQARIVARDGRVLGLEALAVGTRVAGGPVTTSC